MLISILPIFYNYLGDMEKTDYVFWGMKTISLKLLVYSRTRHVAFGSFFFIEPIYFFYLAASVWTPGMINLQITRAPKRGSRNERALRIALFKFLLILVFKVRHFVFFFIITLGNFCRGIWSINTQQIMSTSSFMPNLTLISPLW